MGRKKITIKPITDERNRHVTFNKRKSGLIKKAMELSILCNCQISLVIFNAENQLFEYCSTDPRFILQRYCQVAHLPHERLANADVSVAVHNLTISSINDLTRQREKRERTV